MAKPKTAQWSKFIIALGDGATPTEAFIDVCGLTSKGLNFEAETAETSVLDCDDPDAPAWSEKVVKTKSSNFTGDGVLVTDFREEWWNWFDSGQPRNIRIRHAIPLADGGGYYEGAYLLTTFTENGNQDDAKMSVEVAMANDGPVAWVDAVA